MANTVLTAQVSFMICMTLLDSFQYRELKSERDYLLEKFERLQVCIGTINNLNKQYIYLQKKQAVSVNHDTGTNEKKERPVGSPKTNEIRAQKRERRTAVEIVRDHKCPMEICGKAYG